MYLSLQYETNGLFTRIINIPTEEATKHGFEIGTADEETDQFFIDRLEELDAVKKMTDAMSMSRLFGGALAVMFVDDGKGSLEEPLDMDSTTRIVDLRVFDRSEATPDFESAYQVNYEKPWKIGEPEFYDVATRTGGMFRVHESRCLVFKNGDIASQSYFQQYMLWGLPEYYRIKHALRNFMRTYELPTEMMEKSVIGVFKTNLAEIRAASERGETAMRNRMRGLNRLKGAFRFLGLDKDSEDLSYAQANITGVGEVQHSATSWLSAVSEIPQTLLIGKSPDGMNATGHSDFEMFYNKVERIQNLLYRPNLAILLDVIMQEGLATGKLTERVDITVKFNALWSMSEKEQSEIDHRRAQIDEAKARTANMYVEMGALDPDEVRAGIASDGEFEIDNLIDDEPAPLKYVQKLLQGERV